MHSDPPDEGFGIVAIDEEQLEGVDHNQNELYLKIKNPFVIANLNIHQYVSKYIVFIM